VSARRSGSLRALAARGTLINGSFLVFLSLIGLAKGIVVAALLTTTAYGTWGVLLTALGLVLWLKQIGIGDRYIQQDEADQDLAFRRAFGMELLAHGACFVLMAAAVPAVAAATGQPGVLAPGLVLALIVPASALQFPLRAFQREMRWAGQRTLQAFEPIVAFAVTVALLVAGLGLWALVIGTVAGAWVAAAAALIACPHSRVPSFARGTVRDYTSFSWPVLIYTGSAVVLGQAIYLAGTRLVGLAGVGAIALAATIAQFTDRLDSVLTQTLYPVICSVRDRTDLLAESFVKSNRLTLMWGLPFGVAISLFASDLVSYVIGEQWRYAVGLLQVVGLIAATHHIAFNWDAFYRARGDTKPLAYAGLTSIALTLGLAIPLMAIGGLTGYAIGMAAGQLVYTAVRAHLVRRLFPGFRMLRHAARAAAPTVPAAALVLLARALEPGPRRPWQAVAEVALYAAVTAAATVVLERRLLREVLGYVRRRAAPAAAPAPAPAAAAIASR
jgi:O-antigen/teichoic acid export membrane protein